MPPVDPESPVGVAAPFTSWRPLSLLVSLAFFMEQLDSTIIAPAIPDIAMAFGVAPLSLNLTMTVYLLCAVVFIPTGGHLAARWGTRTVFRAAIWLFVASSVLCALAPDLTTLAVARALQGVGAALMVPVGRMAIVLSTPRGQCSTRTCATATTRRRFPHRGLHFAWNGALRVISPPAPCQLKLAPSSKSAPAPCTG